MSRPADQSRHRLLAARYLDRSLPPRGDLTRSELNTSAHAAMRVFFWGACGGAVLGRGLVCGMRSVGGGVAAGWLVRCTGCRAGVSGAGGRCSALAPCGGDDRSLLGAGVKWLAVADVLSSELIIDHGGREKKLPIDHLERRGRKFGLGGAGAVVEDVGQTDATHWH